METGNPPREDSNPRVDFEGMSRERTDLALQRTLLANERTYSAWLRTGLTAVAAGLGIAELLESISMPGLTRGIGIILILAGMATYFVAMWRYRQTCNDLRYKELGLTPCWMLNLLAVSLLLSTILSLIVLLYPR